MRSPFQRTAQIQDPPRVCRTPKPGIIPDVTGLRAYDIFNHLCDEVASPTYTGRLQIELTGYAPLEVFALDWAPDTFIWSPGTGLNNSVVDFETIGANLEPTVAWVTLTPGTGPAITFLFLLPGC